MSRLQQPVSRKGYAAFMVALLVAGALLALWLRHWGPFIQVAVLGAVFAAIDSRRARRRRRAAPDLHESQL